MSNYGKSGYELQGQIDQLITENQELKDLNTRLDNQRETYWKGYQKLKQTIAEIRKIAETQQSWNECNMKFSETESEDDIFGYNWSALKQIIQKVSEVEDV